MSAGAPGVLLVALDRSTVWFVVPTITPTSNSSPNCSATWTATSPRFSLTWFRSTESARPAARILRRLDLLGPAEIVSREATSFMECAKAFAAAANTELRESLVAYLRHRGQWEQASKALGLHRNTVRYRVERARELLALDLDDPAVAAETWLALRSRGLA